MYNKDSKHWQADVETVTKANSNHEVFLIITQSLETFPSYPQHHKHNTAVQSELREEFFGKVSSYLNTKVLLKNLAWQTYVLHLDKNSLDTNCGNSFWNVSILPFRSRNYGDLMPLFQCWWHLGLEGLLSKHILVGQVFPEAPHSLAWSCGVLASGGLGIEGKGPVYVPGGAGVQVSVIRVIRFHSELILCWMP